MQLAKADKIAQTIVGILSPHCKTINIAGSIRRKKPDVGDIEICALPLCIEAKSSDLFFNEIKSLVREPSFIEAIRQIPGKVKAGNASGRYMKIELQEDIQLDLFMPTAEDYYRIFAIRTGSAKYSAQYIATAWKRLGWCGTENGLRLMSESQKVGENKWECSIPNPTLPPVWQSEQEFFNWLQLKWIEPNLRDIQ